jgi:hypothetical protein
VAGRMLAITCNAWVSRICIFDHHGKKVNACSVRFFAGCPVFQSGKESCATRTSRLTNLMEPLQSVRAYRTASIARNHWTGIAAIQVGKADRKRTEQALESMATCRAPPEHHPNCSAREQFGQLHEEQQEGARMRAALPLDWATETAAAPALPSEKVGERGEWYLGGVATQQLQLAPLPPRRHHLPQRVWERRSPTTNPGGRGTGILPQLGSIAFLLVGCCLN